MEFSREENIRQKCELLNKWLYLRNVNIFLKEYIEKNMAETVAVYGLGDVGKRLIEELQNEGVNIKYAVDKRAVIYFADFDIYTMNDDLPDVDMIIVTVLYDFDNIKGMLPERLKTKTISLKAIVDNLWEGCWNN